MSSPGEDMLMVTPSNLVALEALATYAGMAVDEYTDESVLFGLSMAELSIDAAPEKLHLAIPVQPSGYHCYPITFTPRTEANDANEQALPDDMTSFEDDVEPAETRVPLPLRSDLLARVTDIAMLLCVNRPDFVDQSIGFHHLWSQGLQTGRQILLLETDGSFTVLGFDEGGEQYEDEQTA